MQRTGLASFFGGSPENAKAVAARRQQKAADIGGATLNAGLYAADQAGSLAGKSFVVSAGATVLGAGLAVFPEPSTSAAGIMLMEVGVAGMTTSSNVGLLASGTSAILKGADYAVGDGSLDAAVSEMANATLSYGTALGANKLLKSTFVMGRSPTGINYVPIGVRGPSDRVMQIAPVEGLGITATAVSTSVAVPIHYSRDRR
jgi:hypothetical protein